MVSFAFQTLPESSLNNRRQPRDRKGNLRRLQLKVEEESKCPHAHYRPDKILPKVSAINMFMSDLKSKKEKQTGKKIY